jgi:hypothetical protein
MLIVAEESVWHYFDDLNARKKAQPTDLPARIIPIDLLALLTISWLTLAYENMRSVRQRLKRVCPAAWTVDLEDVFRIMEWTRVSVFKREIPKYRKSDGGDFVFEWDDGQSMSYVHGVTSLTPLTLAPRQSDGSMGWSVLQPGGDQLVEIYRRDLSDELLSALAVSTAIS